MLGAQSEVLSTNISLGIRGMPRSNEEPTDPGAAVYFTLKGHPRALACDKWDRVADNIAAIAMHIEAIRAVDRYGVGTMEQAFAGYAALPATAEDWWVVLEVERTATRAQVEDAYRRLAKRYHPDMSDGDETIMARVNAALAVARKHFDGA